MTGTGSQLAAIPAFLLVIVAFAVFAAAIRRRRIDVDHTYVMVAIMFIALGINAFVAGLALLGYIHEQETITFWAAVTRSVAIVGGSYVAWTWWTVDK
jgi:hypothetical protein